MSIKLAIIGTETLNSDEVSDMELYKRVRALAQERNFTA